jgi:excisionase family DNA binding protein
MKTYTVTETAKLLQLDASRVLQICKDGRLGHTVPRHGRAWVITQDEIDRFIALGPRKAGRPPKQS